MGETACLLATQKKMTNDADFMLQSIDSNNKLVVIEGDATTADGIFLCREKHYTSFNQANIWIVKTSEGGSDVIVDSGLGLWDLKSFLKRKKLIDDEDGGRPYQAVATHIHFDHSGGLHQFDGNFSIHREEADFIREGNSFAAVCYMNRTEIAKRPAESWKPSQYKLRSAQPSRLLEDGDIIDLGGRKFRVMHLPGHSLGSIALFDEQAGDLFSGDIAGNFPVLDCLPNGSITDMIETMEKLLEIAPRIKRVFPGHGDPVDGSRLTQICEDYLNNAGRCHNCTAMISKTLATIVLQGRNTKKKGPRCCYYSCCCCLCV